MDSTWNPKRQQNNANDYTINNRQDSCCCLPMAELVYLTLFTVLSEALNTQSARQSTVS
jgi:hypothetical protein